MTPTLHTEVPRGIRNNNPGNVRHSADTWLGATREQPDPDFVTYAEPRYGIRAMVIILVRYQREHGCDTLAKIARRWAPPSENDTDAYAKDLGGELGIGADQRVDLVRDGLLPGMVAAITRHENRGQMPYDAQLVTAGINLGLAALKIVA